MNKRASLTLSRFGILAAISIACIATTQSCVFDDSDTVLCSSGVRCPTGWTCAAAQEICIRDGCGDGIVDPAAGEICDDGNILDTDSCSADCGALVDCGNGRLEIGEICDDDNNYSGDGCSADCLSEEICGNGYRDFDEVCDDGNTISSDGCRGDCKLLETCGNGRRDPNEVCDDGNIVSGDGCSANCLSIEVCGNGYTDQAEECDMGPLGGATCNTDCTFPFCGDNRHNPAFINPETGIPEQCDDGGNSDECNANCTNARCGDGYHNPEFILRDIGPEQCDDGNDVNTDDCVETCQNARCGDAFVHDGDEQCDDGAENSDGVPLACRLTCTLPICGDGVKDNGVREVGEAIIFSEECDDGNDANTDDCVSGCRQAACGDGFVHVGEEQCDDGNASDTDACPSGAGATCQNARCGDGFVRTAVEQCDDGNTSNSDACPSGPGAACQNARCGDGFVHAGTEDCDGGAGDTGTCDSDCTVVVCGDGHVNAAAGEECEDDAHCAAGSFCQGAGGQACTCF